MMKLQVKPDARNLMLWNLREVELREALNHVLRERDGAVIVVLDQVSEQVRDRPRLPTPSICMQARKQSLNRGYQAAAAGRPCGAETRRRAD